jgi:hypothetical protein
VGHGQKPGQVFVDAMEDLGAKLAREVIDGLTAVLQGDMGHQARRGHDKDHEGNDQKVQKRDGSDRSVLYQGGHLPLNSKLSRADSSLSHPPLSQLQ